VFLLGPYSCVQRTYATKSCYPIVVAELFDLCKPFMHDWTCNFQIVPYLFVDGKRSFRDIVLGMVFCLVAGDDGYLLLPDASGHLQVEPLLSWLTKAKPTTCNGSVRYDISFGKCDVVASCMPVEFSMI
jgi:hypothetical protein